VPRVVHKLQKVRHASEVHSEVLQDFLFDQFSVGLFISPKENFPTDIRVLVTYGIHILTTHFVIVHSRKLSQLSLIDESLSTVLIEMFRRHVCQESLSSLFIFLQTGWETEGKDHSEQLF